MLDDPQLSEVADGLFAWVQPKWIVGPANAGLVRGEGSSVLVDTLFGLKLTPADARHDVVARVDGRFGRWVSARALARTVVQLGHHVAVREHENLGGQLDHLMADS